MTAVSVQDDSFVVRTTTLGGSALSVALQRSEPGAGVGRWLAPRPLHIEAWTDHVRAIRDEFVGSDWYATLAPAFAATGLAAERLSRAATSGVVVTTGQQPGLFGGPAYTFSKALSALAFANELEEATGIRVAPVFWAATDDADWREAATTHLVGVSGLEALTLEGPPTTGIAMADVVLGEMASLLERLDAASGSAAHASVLELVRHAYVPHATIGDAYVQLLRGLLEPLGIAVLDASHASLRAAADPLLRRALQSSTQISQKLRARTAEIAAEGYSPQVEVLDNLSLVFESRMSAQDGQRQRVKDRITIADAARRAREAASGTLGPNVLLRPVVERSVLPTVAYHAGPGEYAYFAQVAPVAEALNAPIPLAVPRWSGEVIERTAFRALERLGLDESELLTPHAAEGHIAEDLLDEHVADALERLRLAIETQLHALQDAAMRSELPIATNVFTGVERDLAHRMARLERRLLSAAKRSGSEQMRDLAVARAALRPLGMSPERVLNLLPTLVRHGPPAVFEQMTREARTQAQQVLNGAAVTK